MPLLLGGAALVAGAFGLKKGADALRDNRRANNLSESAAQLFANAEQELETARADAAATLTKLGALKLAVWHRQIGRFVQLVEQVQAVEIAPLALANEHLPPFSPSELQRMKEVSLQAGEVLAGGAQAVGTGALIGVASYGGAMMLGTASTGTAIATLTGVAATNATLAWFGGGSLAAGGLGMAGGAAVLGGLVAGPALAVGGWLFAAKAQENLANARSLYAQAEEAAAQMAGAASVVHGIGRVADQFHDVIQQFDERMGPMLEELERSLELARQRAPWWQKAFAHLFRRPIPLSYRRLNEAERRVLHAAVQGAQTLRLLLETPILTPEGALHDGSAATLHQITAGSGVSLCHS